MDVVWIPSFLLSMQQVLRMISDMFLYVIYTFPELYSVCIELNMFSDKLQALLETGVFILRWHDPLLALRLMPFLGSSGTSVVRMLAF